MGLGDYGSHFPILAAAVARATGPVLELGSGDWSTLMLHYICRERNIRLLTLDTDQNWLSRYSGYLNPMHHLAHVQEWQKTPVESPAKWFARSQEQWGVAFVDCAPGGDRWKLIKRLKGNADLILAHDSERDHGTGANYEYERVRPLFKYVTEWKRFRPYTLILSDTEPFVIEDCDKVWDPKNT